MSTIATEDVPTPAVERLTLEQRSDVLSRAVSERTRKGWRVVSQTQTQAQLVKGKHTSHVLHLILSLVTIGVWLFVWLGVVIFAGEKQRFLSVDETGLLSEK